MSDSEDAVAEAARRLEGVTLKGKWTVDKLLGAGGMGAVYAATHRNGKRVAIKVLHQQYSAHPEVRARFLREGYVANKVGHPGTVSVSDDDVTEDGSVFLVMDLLEGETIEARWARKGCRLPVQEVLSIANEVLDVLAAAHEMGIVHRDLKPENLFLTREGSIHVLDFGIAGVREFSTGKTPATRVGTIMGTPAFMPPEQARGRWKEVDAQSDLWAVGAILFTLLSGKYVHEGETANEQLASAVTQPARPLQSLAPNVPAAVASIVDRALQREKTERFEDAAAMQRAVRETATAVAAGADLAASVSEPPPAATAATVPAGELTKGTTELTTSSTANPAVAIVGTSPSRRAIAAATGAVVILGIGVVALSGRSNPSPTAAVATPSSSASAPEPRPSVAPTVSAPAATQATVSVDDLPDVEPSATAAHPAANAAPAAPKGPTGAVPASPPARPASPPPKRRNLGF